MSFTLSTSAVCESVTLLPASSTRASPISRAASSLVHSEDARESSEMTSAGFFFEYSLKNSADFSLSNEISAASAAVFSLPFSVFVSSISLSIFLSS